MDYTKTYDDHHKKMGKLGSGSGNPQDKLSLILKSGFIGSCLDYGCGWGMMADSFKDYVGVDISETAIGYAREHNPTKEFHVIENGKLDLGRKFDFAICLSVFTHCTDEGAQKIFKDLRKHTDFAVIDIIHGEVGGTWELMYRNEDVFAGMKYRNLGTNSSKHGTVHTYYSVELGGVSED